MRRFTLPPQAGNANKFLKTDGSNASWADPADISATWGSIVGTLSNQTDLQTALDTKLAKASNLSDVTNASTARTNLGLAIGTDVQAYDATLQGLAGVSTAADKVIQVTGTDTFTTQTFKIQGQTTYAGTITWTGGAAPTTITGQTYNWTQIGNLVTLTISVAYTNAGTTNTSCQFTLPAGAPTPIAPTGFTGNSAKLYSGIGYLDSAVVGNPNAGRCILGNDSTSSGFVIVVVAASISAKCALGTVSYFTS